MPSPDRSAEIRTLAEQLPRMLRVLHGLKARLSTESRERAALVLLFPLVRVGPMRQTALAELVHADQSTVSRHVAALVERGLVHRAADPSDGRATLLVVTEAGQAELAALRSEREAHLSRITAGWSEADLAALTALFGRLLDDLAAALPLSGDVAVPLIPSPTTPEDGA